MTLYICRPFHTPHFKICSNDDKLLNSLCLQYGKYISKSPVSDTYDIEVILQADNSYVISHSEIQVITQNPLAEVDTIIFDNTTYAESVLALHGSAVEWNERAYLFLAPTGSGKTTLASYLTSSNFGYITDDCILLDRNNLRVHPYNCPIHLRDGGLDILKSLEKSPPEKQLIDDAIMRRYIYTPQNCITDSLPLGGIYFIEHSDTQNSIQRLSTNENMIELMKAPTTNYEITPDYLQFLARLAKGMCRNLIYKDMDFVAGIIKKEGIHLEQSIH